MTRETDTLNAAQVLEGEVALVTFTNPESGFAVMQIQTAGQGQTVTACGPLAGVQPGQQVKLEGRWEEEPRYGRQFRAVGGHSAAPVTIDGIRRYLSSGVVRGLGEKMAARIVDHFGVETLSVIDRNPERLAEVRGIGPKILGRLRAAWADQAKIRGAMLFLQSHGVSVALASRILKVYGHAAVSRVRADPYRLATDIQGVGFYTADRIARQLGIAADSRQRAAGALIHALGQLADQGHVFYPEDLLIDHVRRMLDGPTAPLDETLVREASAGPITVEDPPGAGQPRAVYLKALHHCETHLAVGLRRLAAAPRQPLAASHRGVLDAVERRMGIRLAARQREAVDKALNSNLLVVTGGPGTGKTTIVRAIVQLHRLAGRRVRLAAPTGRAAKRLAESTGRDAFTLHRLLEFSPQKGGFQRDADRPLKTDLLVVDETSMIDTVLMYHLVKALASGTALVLVGDVHQLPSVGPGSVLGDIIASRVVPVVVLDEIFRQARRSRIVVNSHLINAGKNPPLDADDDSDFYFIDRPTPEATMETILHLVTQRIPRSRFGLDPMGDIQVISPMHRGALGTENLNRCLQDALNPGPETLVRGAQRWRRRDKVMQIRNDYDKEVFNGDIGQIVSAAANRVTVAFDERAVEYEPAQLDDLVLAYAISVHKSQGSEYPCIVLPLLTQHYVMLQRNLLYTAVTRARRLVVIVGDRRALAMAVGNDRSQRRFTRLAERLAVGMP